MGEGVNRTWGLGLSMRMNWNARKNKIMKRSGRKSIQMRYLFFNCQYSFGIFFRTQKIEKYVETDVYSIHVVFSDFFSYFYVDYFGGRRIAHQIGGPREVGRSFWNLRFVLFFLHLSSTPFSNLMGCKNTSRHFLLLEIGETGGEDADSVQRRPEWYVQSLDGRSD